MQNWLFISMAIGHISTYITKESEAVENHSSEVVTFRNEQLEKTKI